MYANAKLRQLGVRFLDGMVKAAQTAQTMEIPYNEINEQPVPTPSEIAAAIRNPQNILASNVPKVVAAPK